jgi:hypothetical protein
MIQRLKRAWYAFWHAPEPEVDEEPDAVEEEVKKEEVKKEEPPPNKAEHWRDLMSQRPILRIGNDRYILKIDNDGDLVIKYYAGFHKYENVVLYAKDMDKIIPFMIENYQRPHEHCRCCTTWHDWNAP